MGAFKYLGERAGNTSVTGSRVTAALKFLNYNANTNSIKCILFRLIMILFYGHPVFSFDNYRFIPRRAGRQGPFIVGRILCQESDFHNDHPYKQTLWDSASSSVFTIWQLDFPPGVGHGYCWPGLCLLVIAVSSAVWAGDTIRLN